MSRLLTVAAAIGLTGILLASAPGCRKTDEEKRLDATDASAVGAEARSKPFQASILREPFHRPSCRSARKIHPSNLVGYDSREDAVADGHRPCKVCKP